MSNENPNNEARIGLSLLNAGLCITSEDLDELVNRFLAWHLPNSVCSDLCVTIQGHPHRVGTNLLTATEARQMFADIFRRHVAERCAHSENGLCERCCGEVGMF